MVNQVKNSPGTFSEWIEDKVNNLLGNNPIDWDYRHFQDELIKSNPAIVKQENGEAWLEYRGKQIYTDVQNGVRLQPEDYAGLMGEPLYLAKALSKIDPNRSPVYQQHLETMMHNKLGLKESGRYVTPAQDTNNFTIPSVDEIMSKHQLKDIGYTPRISNNTHSKGLSL